MNKKIKRSHNRESLIVESAAKLFADKGYKNTSMRDIAADSEMLPGSIYYHYKSKEELLVAVYKVAVNSLQTKIESELSDKNGPWENIEKAVLTHTNTILKNDPFALLMVRIQPDETPSIKPELVSLRNQYEGVFKGLINNLPLKPSVDKRLLRLMLIGAINSIKLWYKPGQYSPDDIGLAFLQYLKESTVSDDTIDEQ